MMESSMLREEEVEILELKLRDPVTGIIPKLNGEDIIKAVDVVDWLSNGMQVTKVKAEEYAQMLWNRGVFDHIAPPNAFADDNQLFRLKLNENLLNKKITPGDEQQWTQLKQDAASKDSSNADPIVKLHKSIENATKVYQRLLREKNQAATPNTQLALKLLDQTLALITSSSSGSHNAYFNHIMGLLQNPSSFINGVPGDDDDKYISVPYPKKLPAIPENKQHQQGQDGEQGAEVEDILAVSERLESGLLEQLNLAHQQTTLLKQLKTMRLANSPANGSGDPTKQTSALYPNGIDESPISLVRQRSSSYFGPGTLKSVDLSPIVIGIVENKFPKFLIAEPKSDSFNFSVNGPGADQVESTVHSCFNNNFYAKTVSTYPHLPGHPKREGDPICDHFCIQVQSTRVVAAVADGCNWGSRPAEAALKASTAFVDFISKALSNSEIRTVQDAGNQILSAFNYAHNRIIEGKPDIWEAGTTTLLGGVMVEMVESSQTTNASVTQSANLNRSIPNPNAGGAGANKDKLAAAKDPNTPPSRWGFICASVGDCKAFHYSHSTKKFADITKNNRGNVDDAKDPGGRLGPYVDNGQPDLRNLCLHFLPCQENDIIILMSDGVHDNLDPQSIGVTPRELQLPHDNWSDMEFEKIQESKSKYMQEFLKKKIRGLQVDDPLSAKLVVDRLIDHVVETTRSSRDFMVNSPSKPLPDDLKAYPGKMDHSTCVAFKVGVQSL
ncbi:hypothetical protein SAMD00019534_070180 [Acytostelium subglobosum LB1]|uniref:hypothetical protein n=1 Tax=Acytostelium subglobosum LB1 TaxID=1410327 RepID=UPI000644CA55|nr:hypothetical protein SAMD00019534_070180 [Acytostelium subglobosum LB1]GAM23843.1 hypothetical protein SAMD00019534_070180 [Acytostelium subglobosum LB1]|eukprot:XP_012752879.1 hypothetical protein SAMD00019534_070180 [Acytostelium subglobosum LB1]